MKAKHFVFAALVAAQISAHAQSIEFTSFPRVGELGLVRGVVHDVDVTTHDILLIIDVFGTLWTKPTFANPRTPIQSDDSFAANFITGGQDICAQRILAYVVSVNFPAP